MVLLKDVKRKRIDEIEKEEAMRSIFEGVYLTDGSSLLDTHCARWDC